MTWETKILELELTTKCNASCPQCSRNYYGGAVWHSLPLIELNLNWIREKFSAEFLSTLKQIRLVGTYGDPCLAKEFIPIVKWLKSCTQAQLFISTNGSLRTVNWWKELANSLSDQDRVVFGIDGLEDTNHLYRRGTNWKKIISNLSVFNQQGGKSIWQYIVFQHNQHQVEQAREFSKTLGCYGFAIKTTNRFINKKHEKIDQQPVLDKNEKIVYWLKLPTLPAYQNIGYEKYQDAVSTHGTYENYLKHTTISCEALKNKYLSVSAEGLVLPCSWLQDRLYGHEAESHPDRQKLFNLIDQTGGKEKINLNYTNIKDIINGNFFKSLQQSWTNENRLERCASMCGECNSFAGSYSNITKYI